MPYAGTRSPHPLASAHSVLQCPSHSLYFFSLSALFSVPVVFCLPCVLVSFVFSFRYLFYNGFLRFGVCSFPCFVLHFLGFVLCRRFVCLYSWDRLCTMASFSYANVVCRCGLTTPSAVNHKGRCFPVLFSGFRSCAISPLTKLWKE